MGPTASLAADSDNLRRVAEGALFGLMIVDDAAGAILRPGIVSTGSAKSLVTAFYSCTWKYARSG